MLAWCWLTHKFPVTPTILSRPWRPTFLICRLEQFYANVCDCCKKDYLPHFQIVYDLILSGRFILSKKDVCGIIFSICRYVENAEVKERERERRMYGVCVTTHGPIHSVLIWGGHGILLDSHKNGFSRDKAVLLIRFNLSRAERLCGAVKEHVHTDARTPEVINKTCSTH